MVKMELFRWLTPFALTMMVIGALNWGIVGIFEENVLAEIFGTGTLTDIVYAVIGISALVYLPKFLDEMHLSGHGHGPHPRGV